MGSRENERPMTPAEAIATLTHDELKDFVRQKYPIELQESLSFTHGEIIDQKYHEYKLEEELRAAADEAYKALSAPYRKRKKGGVNVVIPPESSHKECARLAQIAWDLTVKTAELRRDFNKEYADVLAAQSKLENHITRVNTL
ncbi:hypothetical protein NQ176_g11422 [Zarea fungicola]|uniref:Uncharacterized protein n=1 Tax=Zarea fungicola TaxID=93591 RepID=A0ACC1MAL8_9HYPO|nr:hypothetical protein NQ176_g11422 [Lecanicillium fungicola]